MINVEDGGGNFWGNLLGGVAGGVLGNALISNLGSATSKIKDAIADVASTVVSSAVEGALRGVISMMDPDTGQEVNTIEFIKDMYERIKKLHQLIVDMKKEVPPDLLGEIQQIRDDLDDIEERLPVTPPPAYTPTETTPEKVTPEVPDEKETETPVGGSESVVPEHLPERIQNIEEILMKNSYLFQSRISDILQHNGRYEVTENTVDIHSGEISDLKEDVEKLTTDVSNIQVSNSGLVTKYTTGSEPFNHKTLLN